MPCFRPECSPSIYVILPYFNFCGFQRRRQLFIEFVEHMKDTEGVRIVIAEVDGPARLPHMCVWKHLRIKPVNNIWVKECLVNMAVKSLPKNWERMAWIDADIEFLNKDWVHEAALELGSSDVIQLFQTAVNLGPNGESMKIDKSFAYMAKESGTPYVKNDIYGFWHPGYAWACTQRAWKRMGGLIDWAILGSGDRHMAHAFYGNIIESCPGNVHPNYKLLLEEYQKKCKGLKLSYIQGTILHKWHGSLVNRKYKERWNILTKLQYDPIGDVTKTTKGLIKLTERGKRFIEPLNDYFQERAEDGIAV